MPGAIIIGAGPGIGTSVAQRLAREGLPVGVRALAQLVARAYEPSAVHVATVTVAGAVAPGTALDSDEIAEQYWRLHTQPRGAWEREVLYSGPLTPRAALRR
jgi:NAD(P)-dependent dehydrogenase (short-subunit alcohol dehydrogenase family)